MHSKLDIYDSVTNQDRRTQIEIIIKVMVIMFNPTFNNISVISWWSVLLVEET
jgi:hypothetical protein